MWVGTFFQKTTVILGIILSASIVGISLFAHAEVNPYFSQLRKFTQSLENKINAEGLALSSYARPPHCPVEGPTFRDIAEKMDAIKNSLLSGKCYQKHSKVIAEINNAMNNLANSPLDIIPAENGAFIENTSGSRISIINNQFQTQSNSLINGLFEISKDQECIDKLRSDGKLSYIAQLLSKVGALGMVFPTTIGTVGASISLAASGSLYVLDKLVHPSFSWEIKQDRDDFLALTCAFYYLRTELYKSDFFSLLPENAPDQIQKAKRISRDLTGLDQNLDRRFTEWRSYRENALHKYHFRNTLIPEHISETDPFDHFLDSYFLIQDTLQFLASKSAHGQSVADRFEVRDYFISHFQELQAATHFADPSAMFSERLNDEISHLIYSDVDQQDLKMTTAMWVGRMMSIADFLERILERGLTVVREEISKFEKTEYDEGITQGEMDAIVKNDYFELKLAVGRLQRDLNRKITNLSRQAEGAQNEYNIFTEFSAIKKTILGSKGWSFVSFLIKDADKNISSFKRKYIRWLDKKDNLKNKALICGETFELASRWDQADRAAKLINDFLLTNYDLITIGDDPYYRFWKIPYRINYAFRFSQTLRSVKDAQSYIEISNERGKDLEKLNLIFGIEERNSYFFSNFGITLIQIQEQEKARKTLEEYLIKNCRTESQFILSRFVYSAENLLGA